MTEITRNPVQCLTRALASLALFPHALSQEEGEGRRREGDARDVLWDAINPSHSCWCPTDSVWTSVERHLGVIFKSNVIWIFCFDATEGFLLRCLAFFMGCSAIPTHIPLLGFLNSIQTSFGRHLDVIWHLTGILAEMLGIFPEVISRFCYCICLNSISAILNISSSKTLSIINITTFVNLWWKW